MSRLPMNPLSPEEQQKIMGQIYQLMGKQVQSYHRHRHMGHSASIPLELAQELMESIEYTINQAGGVFTHPNVEEALRLGQAVLENKLREARAMLELVCGTAPLWQTECRWEALGCLRDYLNRYDYLHLAHRGPDRLFYPILISPPEGIQGIDECLFYLNILWIENQIMAGIADDALEAFWDRLPSAALNQCEHLLINGMGKALIDASLSPLTFEPEERIRLHGAMQGATEETLKQAARVLCQRLHLKDENAGMYAMAVIPQLTMWLGENAPRGSMENLFI